jgi:RNA polymerase sigma-70 factor, ECF subfamily
LTASRDVDSPPSLDNAEVGRTFRQDSGRSVATLIRVFGDIDIAEDAVQEAFAVALRRWPGDGLPPNPGGWITTTARKLAIDRLRRASRGRELTSELAVVSTVSSMPEEVLPVEDDRLRLIFTCCNPALSTEVQVALTLRLLGGLATSEVARAFLVAEPTMAQRLVRAKHKIKAARIPYRVPEEHELPARLRPVLAVTYLIYNAGLNGSAELGLCTEAIRLARLLTSLMPDEPEVAGVLALLLLTESRRSSRLRADGSLVSKLRAKGLVERIGKSRRYCLTPIGLKLGVLLVKLRLRLLGPLASLIRQPNSTAAPRCSNSVDAAYHEVDTALDHLSAALGLQHAA